jgi:hypothetical protein
MRSPVALPERGNATLAPGILFDNTDFSARDTDQDWLNWTAASLPRGMHLDVQEGTNGNSNLVISWTPDLFAAQDSNVVGGAAGHYSFSIRANDGAASVVHTFEVTVANTNHTRCGWRW